MPAAIDLTNQKFGRLTVVELTERNKHGQRLWRCECECGGKATVRVSSLRTGSTTSCGCLQRLKCYQGTAALKHGHTGKNRRTPEYQAWGSLRQRCTNPKNIRYPHYGASGVTVCDRWQGENGFEHFLSDVGARPQGTSIGRFGDVGNYEPGNVKWMTPGEQVANWRPDRTRRGPAKRKS